MYFYRGCSESVLRVLYSAALMTLHYDCEQRYFHSILHDRLNLCLADPQVDDFPFSILSIIVRCLSLKKRPECSFLQEITKIGTDDL